MIDPVHTPKMGLPPSEHSQPTAGGCMKRLLESFAAVSVLTGCAGLTFGPESTTALTYYDPKPYLFISTNADCTSTATILSVPDQARGLVQFRLWHGRTVGYAHRRNDHRSGSENRFKDSGDAELGRDAGHRCRRARKVSCAQGRRLHAWREALQHRQGCRRSQADCCRSVAGNHCGAGRGLDFLRYRGHAGPSRIARKDCR